MKTLGKITILLCGTLLIIFTMDFADFGDSNSPASNHISSYYIKNVMHDTNVPNIVTAILADYRGYDTMFETAVVLTAGLVCFFLLRLPKDENKYKYYRHIQTGFTLKIKKGKGIKIHKNSKTFNRIDSDWVPFDMITKNTVRLVIPFIQLFAFYVVAHGHHSPGGGFQGGVILGATIILFAISRNLRIALNKFSEKVAAIFSAIGVFVYAGCATLCLFFGKNFLDYSGIASLLKTDTVMARSHGILIVETGVAIAVTSVMIWLYYNLASAGKQEEGL